MGRSSNWIPLWLTSEQMHFIKSWATSRTIGQKIPYSTRNHLGNQNGKRNHYKQNSLESNPAVMSNLVCIFLLRIRTHRNNGFSRWFHRKKNPYHKSAWSKNRYDGRYNLCSGLLDKFLPEIRFPLWIYIWIVVVAIIKIINIILGFMVNKKISRSA